MNSEITIRKTIRLAASLYKNYAFTYIDTGIVISRDKQTYKITKAELKRLTQSEIMALIDYHITLSNFAIAYSQAKRADK